MVSAVHEAAILARSIDQEDVSSLRNVQLLLKCSILVSPPSRSAYSVRTACNSGLELVQERV